MEKPHLLVPFPITTIMGCCSAAKIVARCDRPIRPRYVVVSRSVADDFVITDIKVDRTSQLHSDGSVPADTLAGDLVAVVADDSEPKFLEKTGLTAPPLDMDPGTTIELHVTNQSPCARNFSAVAFCLDAGDSWQLQPTLLGSEHTAACEAKTPTATINDIQAIDRSMRATLLKKNLAGGLTQEQLRQACANIGHDLTCGLCAARFYTGIALDTDRHDPTCKTSGQRPCAPREDRPVGPILPDMNSIKGPIAPNVVEILFSNHPRWRKHTVSSSSSDLFQVEGLPGWFRKKDENLSWRWAWCPPT